MRSTIAVLVAVWGFSCAHPAMAAPRARKLTDLTCTAGQTVVFDGTDWQCADLPAATSLSRSDVYYRQTSTEIGAGTDGTLVVRCDNLNDVLLSGGYLLQAGSASSSVLASQPNVDAGEPLGWEVFVFNTTSLNPSTVYVRILCVSTP